MSAPDTEGFFLILPPPRTRNIIAVEINDSMFSELQKRASQYPNVVAIKGDANNLSQLLNGFDIQSPVVLSLQNSLGTWEGEVQKAIDGMRRVAERGKGELIISLFKQEALESRGVDMYRAAEVLVGEVDLDRTDFENGVFRSKTGYLSKWRTAKERQEIAKRLGGTSLNVIEHPSFWILHISYA